MKKPPAFTILICLTLAISCRGSKMVQEMSDLNKLSLNATQFTGKPLKTLLAQIKPPTKYVSGNPENTWAGASGGTHFRFYFVSREEWGRNIEANQPTTFIFIGFELELHNTRKPLPQAGLQRWTDENTKQYGDMIIQKVRVVNAP